MANPLNWNINTLVDAYQARPPLVFAAEGIFMLPSLNVIYGAPGSLKSMLMADLCMCIAMGKPWLETPGITSSFAIPTKQCNVLWIDFDNGKRRTDERFDAIGKAQGADIATPIFYTTMAHPWLDLTKTGMVMDLVSTITGMGVTFVVIDNLGVVSGNSDENTVEMIQVMGNLRLLAERTGASVTAIHHQRKMQGKGMGGRQGDSLRGHSCIEASLDLALQVEREANAESIIVRATKARGADVKPFGAVFVYHQAPGTSELETACFRGLEITVSTSDKAIADAVIEAIEESSTGSLKQSEITKVVKDSLDEGVGINRIRAVIASMEARKELAITIGTGRSHAKLYSIPAVTPTQATIYV